MHGQCGKRVWRSRLHEVNPVEYQRGKCRTTEARELPQPTGLPRSVARHLQQAEQSLEREPLPELVLALRRQLASVLFVHNIQCSL